MIFDTNNRVTPRLPALKAAGTETIIRYLACQTHDPDKVVTPDEARAIAAAGIKLGLVYEVSGQPSGDIIGKRDGDWAACHAPQVGAPTDGSVIIWYAVDYDPPAGDMPGIEAAFAAFNSAVAPAFRVGCYGSGACCDALFAKGLITARWITQSMGFTGSRAAIAAKRYELLQQLPKKICGLDTDPDVKLTPGTDIGDFVPFAPVLPVPETA